MRNEREELAGIIGGKLIMRSSMTETADAILAAGYRKPRTITTPEELDALPVGSVVRSGRHSIYEKANFHGDPEFPFWLSPGVNREFASVVVALPATVLHEPRATR